VSSLRYELGFCIPDDGILHSHGRENLKSYMDGICVLACDVPEIREYHLQPNDQMLWSEGAAREGLEH
jgi:hypothetical protein